ncbi:MAG: TIM barrel protein [Clostridiales bacterium]|jgi:sugar phosphate isomerase/epimerase|nr:TIM barrel protein [Clostridiales bacterium]
MDKVYLATYSYGMDNSLTMLDKIRTAAEIGYAGVELSGGYEGRTASEINEVLKETGIEVISSHVQLGKIEEELPFLAELGAKFVICPMHNFATREEALDLANKLNDLGKKASEYGMKVGYHNHTQEFWKVDGEYLLDIVIKNTDPDYVAFQLDCGWASAAGLDPVEYINTHAGRFISIHVKENSAVIGVEEPKSPGDDSGFKLEFDENGKPIFPPELLRMLEERNKINVAMGTGIVDWKAVKAAADAQGCIAYIVEREHSYNDPKDRIQCLREDFEYLKNNV